MRFENYGFSSTYDPAQPFWMITATRTQVSTPNAECQGEAPKQGGARAKTRVYRWSEQEGRYISLRQ